MTHYKYLIVGGGMAAEAAIRGIRSIDRQGSLALLSSERHPPYKRPPLSKGLWQGKSLEKIWYDTDQHQVSLHLGRHVQTLEPAEKRVIDQQGDSYRYDKLLLATGGTPIRLPFGSDEIIYFRGFDDYFRLRSLSEEKQKFAVIGGGFIGSEIAAALAMNGKQVAMVFPEEGIGARLFPHELSQFLNRYYRDKGVEVLNGRSVTGLSRRQDRQILHIDSASGSNEGTIEVDAVIAGIGIRPNTQLAEQAGLSVDNGIVVDEQLRTTEPTIFAAGDVANFYNPALDSRLRVEHEDNALTMGNCAGRNMAGESVVYHHLPYFYSDMFELGYEAIGRTDARLEMVMEWVEPYKKGFVGYVQNNRVKGVLLWNIWERVATARELIAKSEPVSLDELKKTLLA